MAQDDTPIELRKQLLITQGAMYRSGIVTSKEKVVQGLRADSLARSALKQVGLAALAAWRTRSGVAAASMPAVLPIIAGGIAKAWRQRNWKPVLRGVLIAGAMAGAAALFVGFSRRKQASEEEETEDDF
ncbi:MAG TPA: hypothetical protein VF798_10805 [Burkholderiaceae bacterium]